MQINPVMMTLNNAPATKGSELAQVQMMREALDVQKAEGEAAVRLIGNTTPPVKEPTASAEAGSQRAPVRNGKVDVYA